MNDNVCWGLIGPGRIAHRFAEGMRGAVGSRLQAVASRSAEKASAFADQYGIPVVHTDYASLINDDNVEAIYIATPHRFHYETVRAALLAGKAVLCEKPLTVTADQAAALFDLARENNTFLMEALWSRCLPVWQQVQGWLDSGEIGQVRVMDATFGFRIPREPGDRLLNPDLAGGVLLDMGVYCVSMSQFVMRADPRDVLASVEKGDTGVDERTSALLVYDSAVAQFTCTFQTNTFNGYSISGTEGTIDVDPLFWDTTRARLKRFDGRELSFEEPFRSGGFEYQIEEAARCIRAGCRESPIVPWSHTLGTQRVMDRILASGRVRYPFLEG